MEFEYNGLDVETYQEVSLTGGSPAQWFAAVMDGIGNLYVTPACTTEESAINDVKAWMDAHTKRGRDSTTE